MKIFFSVILLLFLFFKLSNAQQPESKPVMTFKASFYVSAIYGVDYRDEMLDRTVFFQPAFSGGVLVNNWLYFGLFTSKYQWFKYDGAYSHRRDIFAGEIGYPIKNKSDDGFKPIK